MKITFLGATREVTGSKFLVEDGSTRILVDCGLFQGDKKLAIRNRDPLPLDPTTIDAILLTHAHIDHTGYLPVIVKNGFKGPIYCSKATYELCKILLIDSALLQKEHAKKSPLYSVQDAQNSLNFFQPIDYQHKITIGSLTCTLIACYHILGSAFIILDNGTRTLTFSGDLGHFNQLIMKAPPYLQKTDYLVLESTYGNRAHEQLDPLEQLGKLVNKTVKKKGVLIIPSFAVGRAQTILYCLYLLRQKNIIPAIPIFLDSPMAIAVTDLFHHFNDEHKIAAISADIFNLATHTRTVQESKKIMSVKPPMIIIAGSGMADGGRAFHHFKQFITNERNSIAFVGFQAESTTGRALVDGAKEIKIHGKMYKVGAEIQTIDAFSAHADYTEVLEWLSHFTSMPKKIFLTHGQIEAAQSLQKKIEDRFKCPVVVPEYLASFTLD